MSDDWQPGDLALCVRTGDIRTTYVRHRGIGLRKGGIYTLIRFGVDPLDGQRTLWLEDDIPQGRLAIRFRKIRPHQPDAEDAETIRLLAGKPVREPAQ